MKEKLTLLFTIFLMSFCIFMIYKNLTNIQIICILIGFISAIINSGVFIEANRWESEQEI